MEILILTCTILSVLISLPAIAISLYTLVELIAFKKSTHKIEYMPVPMAPDVDNKKNKEFLEAFADNGMDQFIV